MSWSYPIGADYTVPYTAQTAGAVVEAIATASEETFRIVEPDAWTPPDLPPPVQRDVWHAAVAPEALTPMYPPGIGDPNVYTSEVLHLALTPVSAYHAHVVLKRNRGEKLGVYVWAEDHISYERRGNRELIDIDFRLYEIDKAERDESISEEEFDEVYWDEGSALRVRREELEEMDPKFEVARANMDALARIANVLAEVHPVERLDVHPDIQASPSFTKRRLGRPEAGGASGTAAPPS
ncbi:MAG: hypothetical protein AAGK21_04300 [Bacteroidota bacterium]